MSLDNALRTYLVVSHDWKIIILIIVLTTSFLGLYKEDLRSTATDLWQTIVRLETEKYDLQERQKRQDYDVSSSQSFLIFRNNILSFSLIGSVF